MSAAEQQVLEELIVRLDLPRVFFTPECRLADALAPILLAIVSRIERLEQAR